MRRRAVEIDCTVDLAQTAEALHAHVTLDGVEVGPGDTVQVHDAPARVGFGEHVVCSRRATVVRAGLLRRLWTHVTGPFAMISLFEVGFSETSLPTGADRRKA